MNSYSLSYPQLNRSEAYSIKVFRDLLKINHQSLVVVANSVMHPCIVLSSFPLISSFPYSCSLNSLPKEMAISKPFSQTADRRP